MAAGSINLQANDLKVALVTFEDGASGNMSVVVPKEGGVLATEAYAVAKTGDTMTGNLNFSGTGLRITGDFSNTNEASKVLFQTSTLNSNTFVSAIPNGTATVSGLGSFNTVDPTNSSVTYVSTNATESRIIATRSGLGAYLPLTFLTGGVERMRIDTGGNVLVTGSGGLGYGVGSGGAVTQATSKSTAVTLNKPCGQIIMNGAALVAGAFVDFTFNNSAFATYSTMLVNPGWGASSYKTEVVLTTTGAVVIRVTNITAGSLSDALTINFAVIRGATA